MRSLWNTEINACGVDPSLAILADFLTQGVIVPVSVRQNELRFLFGRFASATNACGRLSAPQWRPSTHPRLPPRSRGIGNMDEFVTEWNGGFRGMSLRLFDLARKEWSIYWSSDRTGTLEPPVVGRFEAGIGTFYGRDSHQGTPVLARFLWSDITPGGALWRRAFSTDDGKTWETNWRMHMTRE